MPQKRPRWSQVWPVEKDEIAELANREPREKVCGDAIPHYGLSIALQALRDAEAAKLDNNQTKPEFDGNGPFLLAWAPGADKGRSDVLVLVSDMSNVINNEQAKQVFSQWVTDIQENKELWNDGWKKEKLLLRVRLWADKYGPGILKVIGIKE